MAENKKSFMLYVDLIHTVKKLDKSKVGELFIHILEYVNDLNPVTNDLIIEIAFEPIKQQLKRDLRKYEDTCKKNNIPYVRVDAVNSQITQDHIKSSKFLIKKTVIQCYECVSTLVSI